MLNFGNKEFRNLQEQVGKNQEDIAALKSGIKISYSIPTLTDIVPLTIEENVGKYIYIEDTKKLYTITHRANEGLLAENLGDYPAKGPKGDTGEHGETGATGREPKIGIGHLLPTDESYQSGDMFIIKSNATPGLNKGDVFQKNNVGSWVLQFNMVGPQGLPGDSTVYPNPSIPYHITPATLNKIKINGVVYVINDWRIDDETSNWIYYLKNHLVYDEDNSQIEIGTKVYVDGDISTDSDIKADGDAEIGGNAEITGTVEAGDVGANLSNAINNSLVGHFVRVMSAPQRTTLTDSQIQQIVGGVYINGTFLGYLNPVFLPAAPYGLEYYGSLIAVNSSGDTEIRTYRIASSKVIQVFEDGMNLFLRADGLMNFRGKTFPEYPSNSGTFTLKCVNGTLTWVNG